MYTKPTIYASLIGRIGNNLFQIAAVASLAKKYNCAYAVIPYPYMLPEPDNCLLSDYLRQFKDTLLKDICIQNTHPEQYNIYNEPHYHYQQIPFQENIFLCGYFQSEKYFDQPLIKELFKIPLSVKDILQTKYGSLLREDITSINVRRGDYLNCSEYHPVCSLDYFKRAIDIIGRDKLFMITSDDLTWCKKNFTGDNFYFADRTAPEENLYLQSLCKNNIISNSSFSWWGAWLNPYKNKKVIAPKIWYGPQAASLNFQDLLPETWIKI